MGTPNAEDGLVPEITDEYKSNRDLWWRKALEQTQLHAMGGHDTEETPSIGKTSGSVSQLLPTVDGKESGNKESDNDANDNYEDDEEGDDEDVDEDENDDDEDDEDDDDKDEDGREEERGGTGKRRGESHEEKSQPKRQHLNHG